MSAIRKLSDALLDTNKGLGLHVCIWRPDKSVDAKTKSLRDFLAKEENYGGDWHIDGGWGGPPGPIKVSWDDDESCWINKGFPPWI